MRLTKKRADDGRHYLSGLAEVSNSYHREYGRIQVGHAVEKLAEYEDLEEQGKLLKLPVAIGDEVFFVWMNCPEPYKEEYCKDHDGGCKNCHHRIPDILSINFEEVQELEEKNGWIPVEERLPVVPDNLDDDECPEFNVTIKGCNMATTLRCASDGTWFDEFGHIYPVIAWCPLPDTYQPKKVSEERV